MRAQSFLPLAREFVRAFFLMPWSPAQHRLFEAAAHDPKIAASKGIPQQKAAQMASEGIKKGPAMAAQIRKK